MAQRRVLVADDHPLIVRLLRRTFEGAGYDVLAETAADRVAETVARARPDLVVLDADMQPCERFHALVALAGQGAGQAPPVVVLSGHDEPAVRMRALELGADAFVLKPWEPDELIELARGLIAPKDGAAGRSATAAGRSAEPI